ncbi:MAG: RluA family pseudouridine synthase [Pseudomonadaceae bacterium]|nr:RluA family pseudouridine synthase [Pseudomonadaceae bacterium]
MPGVQLIDIDAELAGQRVDNFVLARLRRVPRSRVYRMLRKGEVRVNGGRVRPTHRLQAGDKVRLPPWQDDSPEPAVAVPSRRLRDLLCESIVFEDAGLLVLDKPAGIAVHGGSGVDLGVIEALRIARDEPNLQLAHRLDRGTSGLLLIARKRSALNLLSAALRDRTVSKHYHVVVRGHWPSRMRRVQKPLLRYETNEGERRVRVDAQGKASRTDFEVISRFGSEATLLRAILHTGRTHQIRVHCLDSGHPVMGDDKYGAGKLEHSRLALHAARLTLPWADRKLVVESEPPGDFLPAVCRSTLADD